MALLRKVKLLLNAIEGYLYKWMVDAHILSIPSLKGDYDIVVSLTSYGRRVGDCIVYYTIVSLLRQKIQPSRIILWLAENEWSDENLPERLKKLRQKGVEIRYCEDIRSYKKLVPTIRLCPNANIMTVDDDMIYSSETISSVWEVHKQKPNEIICRNSSMPFFMNGVPQHYNDWKALVKDQEGTLIFPVGVGGTLYPAGSLHPDVTRSDIFMKLCPLADDIWFWFCGLRNGTNKRYLHVNKKDLTFDALYQYFHKGSALTHSNSVEHQNDKQFRNLFEHYGVKVEEDGSIIGNNIKK